MRAAAATAAAAFAQCDRYTCVHMFVRVSPAGPRQPGGPKGMSTFVYMGSLGLQLPKSICISHIHTRVNKTHTHTDRHAQTQKGKKYMFVLVLVLLVLTALQWHEHVFINTPVPNLRHIHPWAPARRVFFNALQGQQ